MNTKQNYWQLIRNTLVTATNAVLNVRLGRALRIVAINLIVMVFILACMELIARAVLPEQDIYRTVPPGGFVRFHPYVVNLSEGPVDHDGHWRDSLRHKQIPYHIKLNNLGFRMERDLNTTTVYNKAKNERVVLLFGGSAAFGIGSTSNATTIDSWLQRKLNEKQKGIHYTVFNLSVNGWIAYQQLILLELYGLNFKPDWIIFMDGNNDIINLVANNFLKNGNLIEADVTDDVGLPIVTPIIRNIVDGYYYHRLRPAFYRSAFENELIRMSASYRYFTGKEYVPRTQQTSFPRLRDWSRIDQTIDFYLRAQRLVLLQCPTCQFLLSTQPYYRRGYSALSVSAQKELKEKMKNLKFTSALYNDPRWEDINMYALGRITTEMPSICRAYGPRCHYKAIDEVFPSDDDEKESFFIDQVHLLDRGNELIANYYAKVILETDTH